MEKSEGVLGAQRLHIHVYILIDKLFEKGWEDGMGWMIGMNWDELGIIVGGGVGSSERMQK